MNSSGNVGIGTTAPGFALDVKGTGDAQASWANFGKNDGINPNVRIAPDNNDNYSYLQVGIDDSDTTSGLRIARMSSLTSAIANFQVYATNNYFSGNVGIGTTSPWGKLSVTGTGTGTGVNFLLANSANTPIFKVLDDGTATLTGGLTASALSAFSGGLTSYASSTIGDGTATGGLTISGGATTTGYFLAQNTTDSITGFQILDADGGTPILNIDTTNERVGIGTTGPGAKLHVVGTLLVGSGGAGISGSDDLRIENNNPQLVFEDTGGQTNNIFTISHETGGAAPPVNFTLNNAGVISMSFLDNGGVSFGASVGIGTTTPTSLLQVAGATAPKFTLSDTDASANQKHWFIESDTGKFSIGTTSDALVTNSTYRALTIDSSGNVGIGTAAPAYKLDVTGFINTDQYSGYKQAGNTIVYASSTNFSTLVGQSAGASLLADGLYNTALGYEALITATSSDNNTAIGSLSLKANTTGNSNTAVGYGSLALNTTGATNSAFGDTALRSNTTGSLNTAVGYRALYSNTVADKNTAVGFGSLWLNTGSTNTALGHQALLNNTTGNTNLSLGSDSLKTNTTGSSNVAVGVSSLFYNTGNYNSSVGFESLAYNIGGIGNVAVGYKSGEGSGSNQDNRSVIDTYMIFLGYQASRDASIASTTILTNGTAIGYNATVGCSNCISLGGTGANAVNVGIGTTSPWGKLSVAGSAGGTVPLFTVSSSTSAFATTTVFHIDSNGFVGIGRESPAYTLDVLAQGTGVIARFQSANATGCTLATDGTISCTSDERMKKNIEDLSYGLDTVMNLRPVLFNWNYEDGSTLKNLGFLAQDVELLIPKLVVTDEEGMKSLNTTGMIPILVKAVQEINLKITEINNLEKENTWRDNLIAWFANAGNQITRIFTGEVCLTEAGQETVCLNRTELQSLKALLNQVTSPQNEPVIETPEPEPEVVVEEPEDNTTPPDLPLSGEESEIPPDKGDEGGLISAEPEPVAEEEIIEPVVEEPVPEPTPEILEP